MEKNIVLSDSIKQSINNENNNNNNTVSLSESSLGTVVKKQENTIISNDDIESAAILQQFSNYLAKNTSPLSTLTHHYHINNQNDNDNRLQLPICDNKDDKNSCLKRERENNDNNEDLSENESDDDDDDDDSDCSGGNKKTSRRKSSKKKRVRHAVFPMWTMEEDEKLLEKNLELGNDWAKIATFLPGRSRVDVKVRYKSIVSANKKLWNAKDDEKIFNLYRVHHADWKTISTYFEGRTKNAVRVRYKELKRLAFQPIKAPSVGSAKQIFYKRNHPHFHRNSTRADPLGLRAEAMKEELLKRHIEGTCDKCSSCNCNIDQEKQKGSPGHLPMNSPDDEKNNLNTSQDTSTSSQKITSSSPIIIPSPSDSHLMKHMGFSSSNTPMSMSMPMPSPLLPGINWNTPPSVVRVSPQYMLPQSSLGPKYPFIFPSLPQLTQFPSLMVPKGI